MKNLYSNFIGQYPVSKTLRFELIPQGKTLSHIEKEGLIKEDEHRAESYKKIKKIIDEYHKEFINEALYNIHLEGVDEYYDIYLKQNRDDRDKKKLEKIEEKLRKQVVNILAKNPKYNTLFKKELIKKDLVGFVDCDEGKIGLIKEFANFTTYFKGFHENRKNMYSSEAKSTAIGYRIINQNLPKYVDNMKTFEKIRGLTDKLNMEDIQNEASKYIGNDNISTLFDVANYGDYISQNGIDKYNYTIGILNQHINLYNQKTEKKGKLPQLKGLYKQILSDRENLFGGIEYFEKDAEVITAVKEYSVEKEVYISNLKIILADIKQFDISKIHVDTGDLPAISNKVFADWNVIMSEIEENMAKKFKAKNPSSKKKYNAKEEVKKIKSFSLGYIIELLGHDEEFSAYFAAAELFEEIENARQKMLALSGTGEKKLVADEEKIQILKGYLDSVKALQWRIKSLLGSKLEAEKAELFYGEFSQCYDALDDITLLYNKVRNYVTQKPYSKEKIKLNFQNPTLLDGWDVNKEVANTCVILRKDGLYYLALMNKKNKKIFENIEESDENDCYEKMEYKLIPNANRDLPHVFFAAKNIDYYAPSDNILRIKKDETFKKVKNFNRDDLYSLIEFYKKSLDKHTDWKNFNFNFSNTNEYQDISQFYKEVEEQGYRISLKNISAPYVESLVDEGALYLFQIYSKDFSSYSKGRPNLHTLYWKMIFDEKNLKNVVYKLNGEAEVFYRKASIDKNSAVIHKANEAIKNKRRNNDKATSTFEYDLVKDKRYTVDKFQFHVPITINFKTHGKNFINENVNKVLKYNDTPYVIGIDRGERNLLYLVMIDNKGKIVHQETLNRIDSGNKMITDYHDLLDVKEKARNDSRKNWKTIENIKELKEGYLSQVVHKIVTMMVEYNAIIVLENLEVGFKRSRQKVEKQVYQKFEKMLINKLNCLIDKSIEPEEEGGMLKPYQLTNKFESFAKLGKQSGVLFYIPAWNTSKMDPTTGFVNLFYSNYLKYKSVADCKNFWKRFDRISYNEDGRYFEFEFDYNNFTDRAEGTRTKWTACSYGNRVISFRNKEANNQWENKEIELTKEFVSIFKEFNIKYKEGNLIDAIVNIDEKTFHKSILNVFKAMMQMRNSITGTNIDYMVSPVLNAKGKFFNSNDAEEGLPKDADANGAYNIARKGLWAIAQIKETSDEELGKVKFDISNKEWLRYAQEHC